jgi:hypothetical protein
MEMPDRLASHWYCCQCSQGPLSLKLDTHCAACHRRRCLSCKVVLLKAWDGDRRLPKDQELPRSPRRLTTRNDPILNVQSKAKAVSASDPAQGDVPFSTVRSPTPESSICVRSMQAGLEHVQTSVRKNQASRESSSISNEAVAGTSLNKVSAGNDDGLRFSNAGSPESSNPVIDAVRTSPCSSIRSSQATDVSEVPDESCKTVTQQASSILSTFETSKRPVGARPHSENDSIILENETKNYPRLWTRERAKSEPLEPSDGSKSTRRSSAPPENGNSQKRRLSQPERHKELNYKFSKGQNRPLFTVMSLQGFPETEQEFACPFGKEESIRDRFPRCMQDGWPREEELRLVRRSMYHPLSVTNSLSLGTYHRGSCTTRTPWGNCQHRICNWITAKTTEVH